MKFTKMILAAVAVALLLCSCDNAKTESAIETTDFCANAAVSDGYVFRVDNERLNLWDTQSNTYDIFCSQPNCKHKTLAEDKNSACTAVAPDKDQEIRYAFIYKNSLYMICAGNLNETLIYKSDKDGQNRKLFMTLDITLCSLTDPTFSEGLLAFVGSEYITDSKANMQENYSLCSVDLNAKEFQNYGEVGKANESLIARNSLHINKKCIYFQLCEYTENSQHNKIQYIDIGENTEYGIPLLESDDTLNVWQYDDDKIVYAISDNNETHSKVCTMDFEGNDQRSLFEADGYISDVFLSGEKCFYFFSKTDAEKEVRGAVVYDMNSQQTLEYQFAENEWLTVLGHTANGFLLYSQNDENETLELCSDDDFWNLKFEKAQKADTGSDVQ